MKEYRRSSTFVEAVQFIKETEESGVVYIKVDRNEEFISYRKLYEKASCMLFYMQQKGWKKGQEVVLLLEDNMKFCVTLLACMLGGYIPVITQGIGKKKDNSIISEILSGLDSPCIIIDQNIQTESMKITENCWFDDLLKGQGQGVEQKVSEHDMALIQFSSGSTGTPKGVVITHSNLMSCIDGIISHYQLQQNDKLLNWVPLTHDLGLVGMHLAPMVYDMMQYQMSTELFLQHPELWIEKANEHHISILASPNFGFRYTLTALQKESEKNWDLSCIRMIFNGAEVVSTKLCSEFTRYLSKYRLSPEVILPGYGLAEATLTVTSLKPGEKIQEYFVNLNHTAIGELVEFIANDTDEMTLCVADLGEPIKALQIRIAGYEYEELQEGTIGKILLKGDTVTSGYYNQEQLNQELFTEEHWLITGDIGFLMKGRLVVVGREKEVLIINGKNIYPSDVEELIFEFMGKEDMEVAVCKVRKRNEDTDQAIAFLLWNDSLDKFTLWEKSIRKEVNEKIGIDLSYILPLSELPKTESGKIKRYELERAFEQQGYQELLDKLIKVKEKNRKQNTSECNDETKKQLIKIWEEILGVNNIHIEDDFFELGGQSIKAVQLANRLQEQFGVEVQVRQIFSIPTIIQMSEWLKTAAKKEQIRINKASEEDYYLTTKEQKEIYLQSQLDPSGITYNITEAFILKGEPDFDRLTMAFNKVVRKHRIFWAYFKMENDLIVWKVANATDIPIEKLKDSEQSLETAIKEFVRPFQLDKGPLFRAGIGKIKTGEYVFVFDIHHIIFDGTSMGIFNKELASYYNGEAQEEAEIQFKDYLAWNQARKEDEENLAFWRKQLADELPVLNMPLDFIRPSLRSYEGSSIHCEIEKELVQKLAALVKKTKSTLYVVMLSAFQILLEKYTGQEDLITGSPVYKRNNIDTKNMIGNFVATLPIRSRIKKEMTVSEFLKQVEQTVMDVIEHQGEEYEVVKEEIQKSVGIDRNTLVEAFFAMQNFDWNVLALQNINCSEYFVSSRVSKFNLSLYVYPAKQDTIFLELEYCTKLYKKDTMQRFMRHYQTILWEMTGHLEKTIGEVEILDQDEKKKLLFAFNDTKTSYGKEKTIHQALKEQAQRTPDRTVIVWKEQQITCQELDQRSEQIAVELKKHGVGRGSLVGVMLKRSPDMIASLIGILKAGGAYLPIDPKFPVKRIQYMLTDSGSGVLITSHDLTGTVQFHAECIYVEEIVGDTQEIDYLNEPEDLAYVIYTSGSTGNPKGVMITHRSVMNFIKGMTDKVPFSPDQTILGLTTISFDIFVLETFIPLSIGMKIVLADEEEQIDPYLLRSLIKTKKVDIIQITPSRLQLLLGDRDDEISEILECVSELLIGGEEFPIMLHNRLNKHCKARLFNVYGPTETTVWSTVKEVTGNVPLTIGKPIANTRIYIVDKQKKLQPIGVYGDMYIAGDCLFRGYYNKEELTKESITPEIGIPENWMYQTGDVARWLPNGEIAFKGRVDYQVKIRGYRIELGEIEEKLEKNPAVRRAVVIDKKDDSGNKYLCAYVVQKEAVETAVLREYLVKELPNYMVPSYYILLEKFPLTPNGKINKKLLPAPDWNLEQKEYEKPESSLECELAGLFEEVLERKCIGRHDSFFNLGGNSLRAAILLYKIKHRLSVEIPMSQVFATPDIVGLADYLKQYAGKEMVGELILLEKCKESDSYSTALQQKRLYTQYQINKESMSYHMPCLLELVGKLDLNRLSKAFKELIRRNEVFRTSFSVEGEAIVQKIHNQVAFHIEELFCCKEEIEKVALEYVKPFELDKPPLMRAGLIKVEEERHFFVLDIHHIISDGTSVKLMAQELKALYQGELTETIDFTYKDYTTWQEKIQDTRWYLKQKKYWQERLTGEIPVLNLPMDYKRDWMRSYEGNTLRLDISRELTEKITLLAKARGCTLFAVLLSAYYILLHQYSGQDDILVGTPVAGRYDKNMEKIMGMFVNTVVLRNYPKQGKQFNTFLEEIQGSVSMAIENQYIPYEDIVVETASRHTGSDLFSVMFVMQNYDVLDTSWGELHIKQHAFDLHTSKFDMTVTTFEQNNSIHLEFEYNIANWKQETVHRMMKHYKELLDNIVKYPEQELGSINMVTREEKESILKNFCYGEILERNEQSIVERFEEQVRLHPDAIALKSDQGTMTFEELNKAANKTAWFLKEKGAGEDTVIGIFIERSFEMIIGIYGILKVGAAYIPIDVGYPKERIVYLFSQSYMHCVLRKDNKELPEGLETLAYSITEIISNAALKTTNLEMCYRKDRLIYILFTSGSTGNPKGVMVRMDSFMNLLEWYQNELFLTEKDTVLLLSPVSFDLTQKNIYATLLAGGTLYVFPSNIYDYYEMSNVIVENDITMINCAPSAFYPLLDFNEKSGYSKLKNLRYVILGGEPINNLIVRKWYQSWERQTKIVNTYGPTECTDIATFHIAEDKEIIEEGTIPIGRPIPNTAVFILDTKHEMVPVNVTGELYIGGRGVSNGYLNQEELTKERFLDLPFGKVYRTGDLVKWSENGEIMFVGREDAQVKIHGCRIELEEIDQALRTCKGIKDCVIAVKETPANDQILCAYYISEEVIEEKLLRKQLAKKIPAYMVPSYYMRVELIPLSPNGKVDRKALPPVEWDKINTEDKKMPENQLQQKIATIWSEMLGISTIGVEESFFELGGNSITLVTVISRLSNCFNVEIPMNELLDTPTVYWIAEYIEANQKNGENKMKKLERRTYYPVSSAQKRLFILQEMNPKNINYNMSKVFEVQGTLDVEKLEHAFRMMLDRHEILRTYFAIVDQVPVQIIREEAVCSFTYIKCMKEDEKVYVEQFFTPFDLHKLPMVKMQVVKKARERYLVLFDIHHIIADGISVNIFIKELSALYKGIQLSGLEFQYKEYAQWQQERMQSSRMKLQEAYWLEALKDFIYFELPKKYFGNKETEKGELYDFSIEKRENMNIEAFCKSKGITKFTYLVSVFYVVLHNASGQTDLSFGCPFAGRNNYQLENMLGVFLNIAIFRTKISSQKTFGELLEQTGNLVKEVFANQEYSYEELYHQIKTKSGLKENGLFSVLFNYMPVEMEDISLNGEKITEYKEKQIEPKYDVTLYVKEEQGRLKFKLLVKEDTFLDSTIKGLIDGMKLLTETAYQRIEEPVEAFIEHKMTQEEVFFEFSEAHFFEEIEE